MKVLFSLRSRLREALRQGGSTTIGLFFVLSLLICGCDISDTSLPIEENEIWGLYVANYHAGLIETIELKPDHTYVYYFKGKDGKEITIRDKLTLTYHDSTKKQPFVYLSHFRCPYPLVALCYSTDQYLAELDTTQYAYGIGVFKNGSGKIELVRCPNQNQSYIKRKP
jgi:hypothetical protein